MQQFYTYLHCKPNGDPFYVGKGQGQRHSAFKQRNEHHKRVVAKYGRGNIDVFVFPRESEAHAFETEKRWIAQFRREGLELANYTDGGEGPSGAVRTAETKARMSAILIGNKRFLGHKTNHSVATRAKISASRMGQPSGFKGRVLSVEEKERSRAGAKKQATNTPPEIRKARAAAASKARWGKEVITPNLRGKNGMFCAKPKQAGDVSHNKMQLCSSIIIFKEK